MNRLPNEVETYIKLSFYLPVVSLHKWLFPLTPHFRSKEILQVPPPTVPTVVICSRCGLILGECIGGGVKTGCHSCQGKCLTNSFWVIAERLRKEAYPLDIDYEIALVLKEIYHGRNCVLQRSSR